MVCQGIDQTCYIGETRYKAGIFLSEKIAGRMPYGSTLRLQKYDSFRTAETEFLNRYGRVIQDKTVRLNTLYEIRERPLYSVFYTDTCVGITYTENYEQNFQIILRDYTGGVWWNHNLDYKEATRRVWVKLNQTGVNSLSGTMVGVQLHKPYCYHVEDFS